MEMNEMCVILNIKQENGYYTAEKTNGEILYGGITDCGGVDGRDACEVFIQACKHASVLHVSVPLDVSNFKIEGKK